MDELEKNARELILALTEKTLKTLKDKGLLKEPSKLQMLYHSSEMQSLLKKLNAPKYDPNREFRVGDKVSVRKIHGKLPQCRYNGMVKVNEGDCCTIHEKERRNLYWVTIPSGGNWCFDAAYLELVTPIEELEPYYVEQQGEKTGGFCFTVRKRNGYCESTFYFGAARSRDKQQAQAAAEADRDRLNAEYRKEQSND